MKKILVVLSISVCVSFFLTNIVVYAEERNYTKIVKNNRETPILKIRCTYIGKKPTGEFPYNYDWTKRNTDFYDIVFENLTNKPIEFIKYETYTKYPDLSRNERKIRNYKTRPMHDGNILKPYGKKLRNNHFYSSKEPYNIRFYDFLVKFDKKNYFFTIYEIFNKTAEF